MHATQVTFSENPVSANECAVPTHFRYPSFDPAFLYPSFFAYVCFVLSDSWDAAGPEICPRICAFFFLWSGGVLPQVQAPHAFLPNTQASGGHIHPQ